MNIILATTLKNVYFEFVQRCHIKSFKRNHSFQKLHRIIIWNRSSLSFKGELLISYKSADKRMVSFVVATANGKGFISEKGGTPKKYDSNRIMRRTSVSRPVSYRFIIYQQT